VTSEYLLGIDIGTYSSKGVLVRPDGAVAASCSVEHELEIPQPGWAEHDAERAWWKDFLDITRALLDQSGVPPRRIAGIGFSAISPAVLPIDRDGKPLRKAILYGIDNRATEEIAELQQAIEATPSLRNSGITLSSQSAAPKVLWIRRHEPDLWSRTHRVVNGSGFLLHRLTGAATLDVYDAAAGFAPFVDAENCRWTPDTETWMSPGGKLPRITWTCDIAGRVTHEGAGISGLAEGTPVITGTADAAAEAVSAGLARAGDMMVMYGSSTFFILRAGAGCTAPHFWCAPFLEPGTSVVTGGMSTSGSLTRWFRDRFARREIGLEKQGGESAYASLAAEAANSPRGANGLVVLPYFSGERTPIHDPHATGAVYGLRLTHTRADLYRALLESVGYGIRHNIEVMRDEGAQATRILAVGGGTANPLWMQIVSDIAGIEQCLPEQRIGASYGDAFLAGVGIGMFPGISSVSKWVRIARTVQPDPAAQARYEPLYRTYRALYPALKKVNAVRQKPPTAPEGPA
jgi:xylulokinase